MQINRREWLASMGLAIAADLKASEGLFHATTINHLSLTVPDVEKAGEFYAKVFGMRVINDMGARGRMLGLRRNYLALFRGDKAGLNHFSPGVDGLDEAGAGAILKANGYEPFERARNIWACLDPDGTQLHLSETMRRKKSPRRTKRIPSGLDPPGVTQPRCARVSMSGVPLSGTRS